MNVRRLLAGLALVCVVTMGATMMIQDNLLYFPETATQASMVTDRLAAWPSPQAFRGLVAEPRGSPRGTAIVFHGNAGHAGHREFYARTLTRLGLRVILAEYPGYGPREGALGEHSLVADARQTIELAHRQFGGPLLLIGESLGAAVAAAAAQLQHERTAGLLLITPWDRLAQVASHHYPWLPVKWLLRDQYDTATRLAGFDRPVVVAVAGQDSIVPARFGAALHAALRGPKHLIQIDGAGHNDWLDRVDVAWWQQATDSASRASP